MENVFKSIKVWSILEWVNLRVNLTESGTLIYVSVKNEIISEGTSGSVHSYIEHSERGDKRPIWSAHLGWLLPGMCGNT